MGNAQSDEGGSVLVSPLPLSTYPTVTLELLNDCAADLDYFENKDAGASMEVAKLKEAFADLEIHRPVDEPFFQRFAGRGGGAVEVPLVRVLAGLCAVCCGDDPASEKFAFLFSLLTFHEKERIQRNELEILLSAFVRGTCDLIKTDCAPFFEGDEAKAKANEAFEFHDKEESGSTLTLEELSEWADLESDVMFYLDSEQRDAFDEPPQQKIQAATERGAAGRRMTVCAEPVTLDVNWTPPVVDKTPEQKADISRLLAKNILFRDMDANQRSVVIDAFERKTFAPGHKIITQGDMGDFFYVIDAGNCDIHVNDKLVLQVSPGMSFGELALLYDAPRAATVTTTSDTVCWALDRATFKHILMDTTMKQRSLYEGFLSMVPLLGPLEHYERLTIADAFEPRVYEAGEPIVEEYSDDTTHFFIIEEGEAKGTKFGVEGEVCPRLKNGAYFGELALLTDAPRAATITAVAKTRCLLLDRDAFRRLLGPLGELLKRNTDLYKSYEAEIGDKDAVAKRGGGARRGVVMAEAPKHDANFVPKKIVKSDDEIARIQRIIAQNILFKDLDDKQRQIIVDAMGRKAYVPGHKIITQGDMGDFFYVIDAGNCDIHVNDKLVLQVSPGMSFGELALLYDAPRAATVTTTSDTVCWALDRATFKHILMDTTMKQRSLYEGFLMQVPLLEPLDDYERHTIADALEPRVYEAGDVIIEENSDDTTHFFIIEEGEAKGTKSGVEGEACPRLKNGAYFGELALLTDAPRAATITAVAKTRCLLLDRDAFRRLLGPLGELLKPVKGFHTFVWES